MSFRHKFFPIHIQFNVTSSFYVTRCIAARLRERKKKEKKEKTIFIYSYIENDFWDYNLIFLKRK